MNVKINNLLSVLGSQEFNCPKSSENALAERVALPYFSESFFDITFSTGNPPSCRDFLINYVKNNKKVINKLEKDSYGKISKRDILIRAKRSYPSLVRDYHFTLIAKDYFGDNNVFHSIEDDKNGIDCTIIFKGIKFFIHLYVDSPTSRNFRKKKDVRHNFTGHHINVPLQLCFLNKVGDWYLYNENHLIFVKKMMINILERS